MERDLSRVMAFTDGVMAVAITLLVLNLEVPDVAEGDLDEALVDLIPSLIAYLLSFALIGRFWIIHHRLFETLRSFDGWLMALNLTFLALIALMPFATELFDSYTDEALAVATLGAILGLAAFVDWWMGAYSLRRGFVQDEHLEVVSLFSRPVGLGFAAVFLVSVPVAFVSTHAATLLWTLTIVLHYPLGRWQARGT